MGAVLDRFHLRVHLFLFRRRDRPLFLTLLLPLVFEASHPEGVEVVRRAPGVCAASRPDQEFPQTCEEYEEPAPKDQVAFDASLQIELRRLSVLEALLLLPVLRGLVPARRRAACVADDDHWPDALLEQADGLLEVAVQTHEAIRSLVLVRRWRQVWVLLLGELVVGAFDRRDGRPRILLRDRRRTQAKTFYQNRQPRPPGANVA
eukprot:CAMPEP_0170231730 /NCGR_PEP_ID=MMETSP0116_2-20130129/15601_1 /TAXON_ID=400756 /ORGANISM="Durinskia baltica, Strain CSIRO CS-38" /LENGTH=204 /DNA_ID=CAMNT_0010482505 /DNA_START=179 /DNA_END=790 /DNA_ORIENTATION=-